MGKEMETGGGRRGGAGSGAGGALDSSRIAHLYVAKALAETAPQAASHGPALIVDFRIDSNARFAEQYKQYQQVHGGS